jgi:hypothetical protein
MRAERASRSAPPSRRAAGCSSATAGGDGSGSTANGATDAGGGVGGVGLGGKIDAVDERLVVADHARLGFGATAARRGRCPTGGDARVLLGLAGVQIRGDELRLDAQGVLLVRGRADRQLSVRHLGVLEGADRSRRGLTSRGRIVQVVSVRRKYRHSDTPFSFGSN